MFGEFIVGALQSIGLLSGLGISGMMFYKSQKLKSTEFLKNLHQTVEDRACGTMLIGMPGSGKTFKAMMLFLDDIKKGYGALWLSTQGISNSDLLNYIPHNRINDVILLRPYLKKLKGINIFRRYTKSHTERMMIADSVVVLFKRLFDDFKENMQSIVMASTLAVLEYSDKTNTPVCLWDLYTFLTDEGFRHEAAQYVENIAAKDMLNELTDPAAEKSLGAILRRFRKMFYYDSMIAFLSQKEDDIDLLGAAREKKIIICDFYAGGVGVDGVGKENSKFLAELVVTKMQLIAETRNIHSSLYPLYLDEFQTYTSTAENIADFIYLNRQRRMPPTLIFQSRDQLKGGLKSAVDSCGTKYIFKLEANDWNHYQNMYPQYKEPNEKNGKSKTKGAVKKTGQYINKSMPVRECIADIRSYGKNYDTWEKTQDIEEKTNLGYIIEERNIGKHTVDEIVKQVTQKQIQAKKADFQ